MYTADISLAHTLTGHQNPIFAMASGVDPYSLYTGGNDKGVVEWDLATGKFKRILCAVPASVYVLRLLVDSGLLLIGMRNGELWCVDIVKQQLVAKMQTEGKALFSVQVLPGKQEVIAIGEEGVAYVWSLGSFDLLYRFRISNTVVRTIEPYIESDRVVFGDKDGVLYLYDTTDFREITRAKVHSLPVTALSAHRDSLYSGGRDAQLFQLDPTNLSIIRSITPHMFTVYGIFPHKIYPVFATVSRDKSFKIWDTNSLSLLKTVSSEKGYDSHRLSINTGLWIGDRFVTAGDDKVVKVWDVSCVSSK